MMASTKPELAFKYPEHILQAAATNCEKWKVILLVSHLLVAQGIVPAAYALKGQVSPAYTLTCHGTPGQSLYLRYPEVKPSRATRGHLTPESPDYSICSGELWPRTPVQGL